MRYIENCSADDISNGKHYDAGSNSMLIQIMDPPGDFPTPKYKFKEVYQFQFLDIEDCDPADDPEMYISVEQSKELVRLLHRALDNSMNVVVHCWAGVSRSGAVVEVATHMGFYAVEKFRSPNTRVIRLMMQELGLPYEVPKHNWREDYRKYLGAKIS